MLEVAHALTVQADRTTITLADAEAALALRSVRYGDDEHYDIISAFIKSIRGSDPDAGLYWLARMLEAGEDARFIARRLVILASEDIGLADPQALAHRRRRRPRRRVRRPARGRDQPRARGDPPGARAEEQQRHRGARARPRPRSGTAGPGPVPMHLRDAHYRGAQMLGHGKGYVYPHDDPTGWVPQEHLPVEVAGERFYRAARARRGAAT